MMGWEDLLKKPIAPVVELDQAALDRLDDARALIAAGRPASAISACLYALEIRLKVLVCKKLDLSGLPGAFKIHDLEALLILTGFSQRLNDPAATAVKQNWEEVVKMANLIEHYRYRPDATWKTSEAMTLLNWLEDPGNGVITWLLAQP
jgi:hypothetical protein